MADHITGGVIIEIMHWDAPDHGRPNFAAKEEVWLECLGQYINNIERTDSLLRWEMRKEINESI